MRPFSRLPLRSFVVLGFVLGAAALLFLAFSQQVLAAVCVISILLLNLFFYLRIEPALEEMRAMLQRLDQVRRDFVANVSHELKTPITSIKGFVETLLDGAMRNENDAQRFLKIIAKQADRLSSIIDDLLTLARLESEQLPELLIKEREDLQELLMSVVEACRPLATAKSIKLQNHCPAGLSLVIDRSLFEQALMNLVENAIKYSGSGTSVDLRASSTDGVLTISVEDEGPGIPEEHLNRLFERFYRVDKARSRQLGGTGLGLSIVKHVCSVHGGTVEVNSVVGRGSKFSMLLPDQS